MSAVMSSPPYSPPSPPSPSYFQDPKPDISLQAFHERSDEGISDRLYQRTAQLFSSQYGVWGPEAASRMGPSFYQGRRIRLSPNRLRRECVPNTMGQENMLVVALEEPELALVGYAYAVCWKWGAQRACWITQLCIKEEFRKQGLATKILCEIRKETPNTHFFGILSSHPAAIMAACRAFGHGINNLDINFVVETAAAMTWSCPVGYVKTAGLGGVLREMSDDEDEEEFAQERRDAMEAYLNPPVGGGGEICCAATSFWIDHAETERALEELRNHPSPVSQERVVWRLGDLPEGYEFVALFDNHLVNGVSDTEAAPAEP